MIILVKRPPESRSNPLGLKGEHNRIFNKQLLTKSLFEKAIKCGMMIPIDQNNL